MPYAKTSYSNLESSKSNNLAKKNMKSAISLKTSLATTSRNPKKPMWFSKIRKTASKSKWKILKDSTRNESLSINSNLTSYWNKTRSLNRNVSLLMRKITGWNFRLRKLGERISDWKRKLSRWEFKLRIEKRKSWERMKIGWRRRLSDTRKR